MKANEVLSTLRISRGTLCNYVKQGIIKVEKRPHGRFEYDKDSVYALINGGERKIFVYGRVSTQKQKADLETQIELLKQYCFSKGYKIDGVYKDIASGISFEKRVDFFKLLDFVIDNKDVKRIIKFVDCPRDAGSFPVGARVSKYGCEI